MKLLAIAVLLGITAALPQSKGKGGDEPAGSFGNRGKNTENDLLEMAGGCKDIYFIMARASTEPGNMVSASFRLMLLVDIDILGQGRFHGPNRLRRPEERIS
jgi:hypothetical protein